MKLQFLGGVQTVTGSKTLLELGGLKVLVDCGLFQGLKELRTKNREPLSINPRKIDAVLLTHAHLDHCGYLPILARDGFRGKIYCSRPTLELTDLILRDSAKINEEDASFANNHGYSKHVPALALYTEKDVDRVINQFQTVECGKWLPLKKGVEFRLKPSGHILGSTFVEISAGGKHFVFSGDLGRRNPLLYEKPASIESADYLILESTYGDRNHIDEPSSETTSDKLARVVRETIGRGGQILIPSFSVGRVQELLFLLSELKRSQKIPDVPVYLDSPMGTAATKIFTEFPSWHRLTRAEVDRFSKMTTVLESRAESIQVMREAAPSIIIAGSGMMTGGRILHHLTARVDDENSTVLLVGYQAQGTRGRLIRDGATELKMHGRYYTIKCKVEELPGLSAHADQCETIDWLRGFENPPIETFLNHSDPQASDALRVKISDVLGWKCSIPKLDEVFSLQDESLESIQQPIMSRTI